MSNKLANAQVALTPKTAQQNLLKEIDTILGISSNPESLKKSIQHLLFVYMSSEASVVSFQTNNTIAQDLYHLTTIAEALERYNKNSKLNLN
jgi:hypothetical protein